MVELTTNETPVQIELPPVAAVITTFNRRELLVQCLRSILDQTVSVQSIYIVDNASSDDTFGFLEEAGFLDIEIVHYIRSNENTGGAGGFNTGLTVALQHGPSWFWLMDDDVAPAKDCLERLLEFRQVSECLHPRRLNPDGSDYPWEQYVDILTSVRSQLNNPSFTNGKRITFTNVACFEGMLVTRRILDTVGLPDKKYFIGDDDTIFGVKAATHTNIGFVADAKLQRLGDPVHSVAPWKAYYMIRNRFYLFRDACDYYGLTPSGPEYALMCGAQVIELLRYVRNNPRHLRPSLRGFVDGLRYSRSRRVSA